VNDEWIPRFNPSQIGAHRVRDYIIRLVFGAAISLVAGAIGMKFGPRLGGVLLGFPAILPASLTLIEKKEGKEQASVDSIGAGLGAVAMIAFAVIVSLTVVSWGVLPSLAASLVVWLAVAIGLYVLVQVTHGREPHAP
jgi:hypothetical protein